MKSYAPKSVHFFETVVHVAWHWTLSIRFDASLLLPDFASCMTGSYAFVRVCYFWGIWHDCVCLHNCAKAAPQLPRPSGLVACETGRSLLCYGHFAAASIACRTWSLRAGFDIVFGSWSPLSRPLERMPFMPPSSCAVPLHCWSSIAGVAM